MSQPPSTQTESCPSKVQVVRRRDFLAAGAAVAAGAYLGGSVALAEAPGTGDVDVTDQDRKYMTQAIQQMRQAGVVDKTGGPFGCLLYTSPSPRD